MIYYITKQQEIDPVFQSCSIQDMIEYFKEHSEIQVDTETTGFFNFKNEVILLQLGDYDNQFVINFSNLSLQEKDIINTEIFCNKNITKLFQNAKFDIKFLWLHGFDIVNVYDTLLAECLLNAGKDTPDGFYGLYSMGKRYCNVELDKEIRGAINSHGLSTRVITYAANDVKYLSKIKEQQLIKLKEDKLVGDNHQDIHTVVGLEMNAVIVFASIEYNGIKVDVDKWKTIKLKVQEEVDKVSKAVDDIIWENDKLKKFRFTYQDLFTESYQTTKINWSSSQQKLKVIKVLFPEIQDTSERVLSKYKNKHKLIAKLLEYNKVLKLKTAFADKMESHINPVTKRVHTEFWQLLDTGRVSSKNPNLQQIPARTELGGTMRSAFVADKGNKLVGGDYAGCELRILAEFSKDPVWINAFLEGKDLHSELCAMTFNIPITDVKKNTPFKPELKYRDVQKTLNFGLAYGMSEFKLADTIEIPVDEAAKIIKKFFNAVPLVESFLTTIGRLGRDRGFIRSPKPYGRIRWFDGYENRDDFKRLGQIERQSKNHPMQAGNADMTKLALVMLYNTIKENNYPVKIIHTVHDEIQTEVIEEFAKEWANIMSTKMNEAASVILKTIPMVTDCKISDYWSK